MLRLLAGPVLRVQQGQLLQQAQGKQINAAAAALASWAAFSLVGTCKYPLCVACPWLAAGFGATAVDDVDGAITAITVTGLAAVNTSQARQQSLCGPWRRL